MVERKTVTLSLVSLCALDLRPFNLVSGAGFASFVQCLLDVGFNAERRLLAADLLPEPDTVRRNLVSQAAQARVPLKSTLIEASLEMIWVAMTTDLWTEPVSNISYISFTATWIT
jgi:hypothetical protein